MIEYADLRAFRECLYGMDGQDVEIVIKKRKKKRSCNQNSYYWGVVLKLISDYSGHTEDELHDHFRARFLAVRTGDFMRWKMHSTTALDTVQMEEYLAKIRQWASETLALYVPEPNEVDYE